MILNLTRGEKLADQVRICEKFWSRLMGLLGSAKLDTNEACWLIPCNSVHTLGMKYPIHVYFLNKENEVIGITKDLKPNRLTSVRAAAHSVIEFASGVSRNCEVGDRLAVEMV